MIDKDEAIRLLRKEVANKGGDFVYRSPVTPWEEPGQGICVYFHEGEPSCIVGHAISDYVADDERKNFDYEGNEVCSIPADVLGMKIPDVSFEAGRIFKAAQRHQDNGNSWSAALEEAEIAYRELGGTE